MKTQKKKTFKLNKLKVASLKEANFIKGGTRGRLLTNEDVSNCNG